MATGMRMRFTQTFDLTMGWGPKTTWIPFSEVVFAASSFTLNQRWKSHESGKSKATFDQRRTLSTTTKFPSLNSECVFHVPAMLVLGATRSPTRTTSAETCIGGGKLTSVTKDLMLKLNLINRSDRKSQVRQCLGLCPAVSLAKEDQNQLYKNPTVA